MSEENEVETQYIKDAIRVMVRGGFRSMDEIREWISETISEDFHTEDKALLAEMVGEAEKMLQALRQEAKAWPERTRNDALDDAFKELNDRGIIALQSAGFTQGDGWADCNEIASRLRSSISRVFGFRKKPQGAAFYHEQDLARGVNGLGVDITFGAYGKGDAAGLEVGRIVVEVLKSQGFDVQWNGSLDSRIHTGPFPWQRRPV